MMVRNVAVTLIIVKFLQSVNVVCGQNTSFILTSSSKITSTTEVVWSASTLSTFSLWKTSSSQILKTVNVKEINGTISNFTATMITGSESYKFQSKSFNHSAKSITSSSEYSANISFSASSSSNVLNSTYNFTFPTGINTAVSTQSSSPVFSSPFTLVNSSYTPNLISSSGDNSTTDTSTSHASTSFVSSSKVRHQLSELTTYSHSPIFSLSAKNSFSESLMTFTSSSTRFSLTSKMSFSRIAAAFSIRTFTGTKTSKNLYLTSSPATSVKYFPSFSQRISATSFLEPSSQHFPSATPNFTTVQSKSPNGTVIIAPSSDTSTMSIKTSEAINSGKPTPRKTFSSSTIKIAPSKRFSLTSKMSFSRIAAAFSTRTFTGTKTSKNLNLTSSPATSVKYFPSFSQRISATSFLESSSQHFPSATSNFTTVQSKSPNRTVIIAPSSDTSTMSIKTSEAINSGKATERKTFSRSATKIAPSKSVNVLSSMHNFMEFDGEILVSVKYSFKNKYNSLKKVADSVESILDVALRMVSGYIYSKVLQITTQDDSSTFQCTFKIFIRQSSSETAATLQEKINKYNETSGFGNFTLHSVETSAASHPSSTEHKLYLWAIIAIGVLGVLCLFLLVALVYIKKKLKRLRKRKDSSERYAGIFPAVIDDTDESKNVPLQLRRVSSTESRKSMKFSDQGSVDSQPEGNCDGQSSPGESERKDKIVTENQSLPRNGNLQIHDDDDDEDQTNFSTFTRKTLT